MCGAFLGFETDRDVFDGLHKVCHKSWLTVTHKLNIIQAQPALQGKLGNTDTSTGCYNHSVCYSTLFHTKKNKR
jgi:hypothetical protein